MNAMNNAGIEGISALDSVFDAQDRLYARLRWGILVSLVINAFLWRSVSGLITHQAPLQPKIVEITRVIIDKRGKKTPKVVTHQQIKKKVAQLKKKIVARRIMKPKLVQKPPPRIPHPRPVQQARKPQPAHPAPRPPEGAHHRVLTARADKNAPPEPDEPSVQPGGNASVGAPIEHQNPGNAVVNPPESVHPAPPPPVEPAPKSAPPPPPEPAPKPVEKPVEKPAPKEKEKPAPPPPPKPKGPTRDAEPTNTVKPDIPDELKDQEFKSFVRVRVRISGDGDATPELRTSSGNAEIDRRVLEALRRWRWKPALRDGEPVSSVQLFKFEFEVY
jgi:protein TonB